LTAKKDAHAAARFFQKTLQADHTHSSRVINTDENAAYPRATEKLKHQVVLSQKTHNLE
jgi:transposase-like protein